MCGTVKSSFKGFPVELKAKKVCEEAGSSKQMQNGAIVATAWLENKRRNPVRMLSTMFSPNLLIESVKSKQQNVLNKDVPSPKPVDEYNKFMGGGDLSDQLRVEFRTARNAKRWWTYVFFYVTYVHTFTK